MGWKTVSVGSGLRESASADRRVTRCDCQLQAQEASLIIASRIPKRYEHCELSSFTTDFPNADPSLSLALLCAAKFAQEYDPREGTGLLFTGGVGTGKTHLAVGIIKELIAKHIPCLFYDYRELLKQIQNSYNTTVQTTELDVLRPVFEADVLVLDELGAVKPTEWVGDTISFILNSRYNNKRVTIITTNLPNLQKGLYKNKLNPGSKEAAEQAMQDKTLGDQIGEPMRSRLHEMCRIVDLRGKDFRPRFRNASFR
jgi:DNA replication protein DnaC